MPAKPSRRKATPAPTPRDRSPPPKAIKVGKRLEKVAREIKDADEFVEHVAGLANRYRREYALQAGDAQAELRQALRNFHKHATALAAWLQAANAGKPTAIERKAFDAIGTALHGSPILGRPQGVQVSEWLTRAAQIAEETTSKKRPTDNAALRIAAEGLRATFEYHKLKVSLTAGDQPADAIRLLCAIARDAGDANVEPDAARAALRDSNRRPTPAAA